GPPHLAARGARPAAPPASAPRRYVSPPPRAPQESAPASPQESARRAWLPGAAPSHAVPDSQRSDSIFDRPLPPTPQPPSPAAREVGTAADHALLDAAPEDALGVAAEEVDGALRAEKSERAGDAAAPAPELARGRGFFNRLKFGRSQRHPVEPQARQERMFEPSPHEPHPHEGFSEPMLESSFPLDDSHPPADQDRYASTAAIDDEYAYEEADEDVAPRRRYGDLSKSLVAAAVVAVLVGIGVWQWPNMVALYRSFRAPAVDTARDVPPPAATRPKITDRIEPGSPQAPATQAPATQAAVPAAQKVVLYEEDP